MNRLRKYWGALLVLGVLLFIFSLLPLGTALEFGKDEGFEVIKPFLCLKGFSLYKDIWNDQPPMLTVLLTWAFRVWGPTILVARLVAAGFGLVLFLAFFQLVRKRSGTWAALLAAFLLLASPVVLQLTVSIMLEGPAFALALVSAVLVFRWCSRPHPGWLLASGVVMGVALQTKLTSVLVAPAIIAELVVSRWSSRDQRSVRKAVLDIAQWGASVCVVFLVIGSIWARGSLQTSLKSHLNDRPVAGFGRAQDYVLPGALVLNHLDGIVAAALGLVLLAKQKRCREYAFPSVLLLTALGIHAVHRPWWNYYYLHLAIPLAWLGGVCLRDIISRAATLLTGVNIGQLVHSSPPKRKHEAKRKPPAPGPRPFTPAHVWKAVGLCGAAALLLARPERRLEGNIKDLRQRPLIASNAILSGMKRYAPQTRWAYADSVIYAFHAQIPVPPKLAVVMLKRFWSGQITTESIVDTCKSYHPEQVVLPRTPAAQWKDLLEREYTPACSNEDWTLYTAKSISRSARVPETTRVP